MRTLNLNEGDPVRLNGAALPKGKMVKIQAQSTEFLQVSDPKAVWVIFLLLSNFSAELVIGSSPPFASTPFCQKATLSKLPTMTLHSNSLS
jgi:hypothetical protein